MLATSDREKTLYNFFKTQWNYPTKNDWTVTVKKDLKDFDIKEDLEYITSMSKRKFKTLVKSKAQEYEVKDLNKIKETLSKIKNISHKKLKMSKYFELKEITVDQAKLVFQFRSRMANYKDNYKSTNPVNVCPLCHNHSDTQEQSFKCSIVLESTEVKGKYKNIIEGDITKEVARTIENITKIRESSLKEAQQCTGIPSAADTD